MKIIKQYPERINGKEIESNVSEREFKDRFNHIIKVTRWKNAPNQVEFWITDYSGKRDRHMGFVVEGEEFEEFSKFLGLEVK